VFEIEVRHYFTALHAVSINGVMEELHSHDWQVRVCLGREQLDHEHLLVDFHAVENDIVASVAPFTDGVFNGTPPFDRIIPTAERIAEYVGGVISQNLPSAVQLQWVSVEEAPGCIARWYPKHLIQEGS